MSKPVALTDLTAWHLAQAGWCRHSATFHAPNQPEPTRRMLIEQAEMHGRFAEVALRASIAAATEPAAWLWTSRNGPSKHVQAFVTKPPPSMLNDPQCQPLYLATKASTPTRGVNIVMAGESIDNDAGSFAVQGRCFTELERELIGKLEVAARTLVTAQTEAYAEGRADQHADQAKALEKCQRCGGSGMVDDGFLTHDGDGPFDGPIKCVKDCPACDGRNAPPL